MFTGIVQAVGRVAQLTSTGSSRRLVIELNGLATRTMRPGDSIAVNGACLTMAEIAGDRFAADVSAETGRLTTLGTLSAGSLVNLEPAVTLAEPLGGHLVTGHVDGTGEVAEIVPDGDMRLVWFAVPAELRRYVARKGSLCIDGVSLTVNDVKDGRALVTLVPHTLSHTIMRNYAAGTRVNLEVDLLARYVERLLAER
jgi:riboflavin synthase